MEDHEAILSIRVKKFVQNMNEKHSPLSATFINISDKLIGYLDIYEVGYENIEKVYEMIHWAEQHENFKEIEAELKNLVDTFWE